jgi:adenosylcobinamide-phosphate synthase
MSAALLAGYVADLAVGDPGRLHPVAGFGRLATALERRLWRPRRAAGAAHAALLVAASAGAVALARRLTRGRPRVRGALDAAAVWACLGGRSLAREAFGLASVVEAGDLPRARSRARALVGRDTADLDGAELCRAAVESVAENTADAVVGPLVWCAVAGPAGAAAYRAANTLDAMVGHRSRRYERFGWASARLDDLLTWPAARAAALLAVALAPRVGGRSSAAWTALRRDGARHPSPNAGRLEAAFAGALGVSLGGRNRYEGRVEERPRIGGGRAPGPEDVRRAARLSLAVGASAACCAAAAAALRPGGPR